jgi:hypothetical protein
MHQYQQSCKKKSVLQCTVQKTLKREKINDSPRLLWSAGVCYGLKAFEADLNLLHKHVSEQIHVLFPSCEAWDSVVVKALRY